MKYVLSTQLLAFSLIGIAASADAQGFVDSPVNINARKLPAFYLGHSPSTIYPTLEAKKITKGRYETSAQFQARSARLTSKPLFGTTYMWSPLGFCIPPSWCDYDADSRIFTAHFALYKDTEYTGGLSDTSSFDYLRTLTQSYRDYSNSYEAQNAFGAETTVYTEGTSNYGVGVVNWQDFKFIPTESSGEKYRLSYQTTLPPASAQRLEKNIRLLLVGYSTTPYRIVDYKVREATYSSPFSENHSYYFVALRLKEAWFYDVTSGYIFNKVIPAQFGGTKPVGGSSSNNRKLALSNPVSAQVARNADGSIKTSANCCQGISKSVKAELFASSRIAPISTNQASNLSDKNLRLAINEMFARYGMTFKDPGLQAYFCARSWYKPNVDKTGEEIYQQMSATEKKNLKALTAERDRRKQS